MAQAQVDAPATLQEAPTLLLVRENKERVRKLRHASENLIESLGSARLSLPCCQKAPENPFRLASRRHERKERCSRRRRLEARGGLTNDGTLDAPAAAALTAAGWLDEWRERFDCWWLGLGSGVQARLHSCLAALSLHLGSRLVEGPLAGPAQPLSSQNAIEAGCEWLSDGTLELPSFPDLGELRLRGKSFPPIPQLVPSREHLQQLMGVSGSLDAATTEQPTTTSYNRWSEVATGTTVGFLGGLGLAFLLRASRSQRAARGAACGVQRQPPHSCRSSHSSMSSVSHSISMSMSR